MVTSWNFRYLKKSLEIYPADDRMEDLLNHHFSHNDDVDSNYEDPIGFSLEISRL